MRGSDPAGHPIRTVERPNGKLLPIFVAESDVANVSYLPRNNSQVRSRFDRKPISVGGIRYLTPSQASRMFGVTAEGVMGWLKRGSVVGFDLEVIQYGNPKRPLISEDCALALAHILKHQPAKRGRTKTLPLDRPLYPVLHNEGSEKPTVNEK